MSNPQWGVRLLPEKIERLNSLIDRRFLGDRQKFVDAVLEKLEEVKYPEIHKLVQGLMRFNEEQEVKFDKLLINYQLVYKLLGETSQVNIRKYLDLRSQEIRGHHEKMGLGDENKSWNITNRLKYIRTSDKENNEQAKQAKVDQLKLELKPYISA